MMLVGRIKPPKAQRHSFGYFQSQPVLRKLRTVGVEKAQRLPFLYLSPFFKSVFYAFGLVLGMNIAFAQQPAPTPPPRLSPDTTRSATKNKPKFPVEFQGDSLFIRFSKQQGDIGRLVGKTQVKYDQIQVEGAQLNYFFNQNVVEAITVADIRPKFTRGKENFTAEKLSFNLKTERGRFVQGKTVMQDGFVLGAIAKTRGDSILYIQNGVYTTCDNEDHPHYGLRASRMKVVNKSWIFTGPIQLKLLNIPIPIVLPFGAIPTIEGRRSGPLTPSYGYQQSQGYYLNNWGWYWAINDYFDAQVKFGIWTLGSFRVNPSFNYAKRRLYNGSVSMTWQRVLTGERGDPGRSPRNVWDLSLRHSQTIDPYSTLSANISLANDRYIKALSESYDDRVTSNSRTNSSASYDRRWQYKGRSISVSGNLSDSPTTRSANLTLPSFRFSQRTQNPFRTANVSEQSRWIENFQYEFGFNTQSQYNFQPLSTDASDYRWWDGIGSPEVYQAVTGLDPNQRFYMTGNGNFSASMPYTFRKTPFRKKNMELVFSPNFNLEEYIVSRQEERTRVYSGTSYRDSTAYRSDFVFFHDMGLSFSASTQVFGTFPWKIGSINGFRHVMRPSVSFSMKPDYQQEVWGYFKTLKDKAGNEVKDAKGNPVQYAIDSRISASQSRSLSWNLGNVFRARRIKTDSTGTVQKNAFDLFSLNLSGGYNFAADSLNWSPISFSGYTTVGKFNFNLGGQYGLYGAPLGKLSSFSSSVSTSFDSRTLKRGANAGNNPNAQRTNNTPALESRMDTRKPSKTTEPPAYYTDYAIPWSVSLNANYSYTAPFTTTSKASQAATINANFQFQLSPVWRLSGRTGFDFIAGDVASTEISVYRDLHCWEMSFRAVPFGRYQSFQFSLNVKSGKLRSFLKLDHPRSSIRPDLSGILR